MLFEPDVDAERDGGVEGCRNAVLPCELPQQPGAKLFTLTRLLISQAARGQ
jgi:hypothetical protein